MTSWKPWPAWTIVWRVCGILRVTWSKLKSDVEVSLLGRRAYIFSSSAAQVLCFSRCIFGIDLYAVRGQADRNIFPRSEGCLACLVLFGLWEARLVSDGLALGRWPFQDTDCEITILRPQKYIGFLLLVLGHLSTRMNVGSHMQGATTRSQEDQVGRYA